MLLRRLVCRVLGHRKVLCPGFAGVTLVYCLRCGLILKQLHDNKFFLTDRVAVYRKVWPSNLTKEGGEGIKKGGKPVPMKPAQKTKTRPGKPVPQGGEQSS